MSGDLRKRAEALLQTDPDVTPELSTVDVQKLIHELDVHHIELQMQNEELTRTLRELHDSRNAYAELYNTAPVGYLTCDRDGVITRANETLGRMLGIGQEGLAGRKLSDFVVAGSQNEWFRHRRSMLAGAEKLSAELDMKPRRGPFIHVRMECRVHPGAIEADWCFRAALVDITERKQAEEALRESEQFNQAVLDSLTAHIAVIDRQGSILGVNARWRQFAHENGAAGDPQVEPGANYLDICWQAVRQGDEEAEEALAGIRSVLEDKQPRFQCEYPCHLPDRQRWFLMQVTPVAAQSDMVILSHMEITERKQAEEALNESERRLRTILESTPDPVFLKDRQGRLVLVNRATYESIGKPADEIIGKTDAEIFDDPAIGRAITETDRRIMKSGQSEVVEEEVLTPGGRRTFLSTKTPCRDENGAVTGLVGVARDITERKQVRMELQRQKKVLQSIFDYAPVLFVMWDAEMHRFTLNRKTEEVLGWTSEDANAGDFMEKVYPDPDDRAEVAAFMESLETGWREFKPMTKEGTCVPVEWANIRLTDDTMVGIGVDLRERKQADLLQRRLAQFPKENPNPVLRVGPAGKLFYANRSAKEWLERLEWAGEEPLPAPVVEISGRALEQNGVVEEEIEDAAKRTLWTSAVQPEGERYVNLYGRDVTERKKIEAQLVELNAQLENRVKARTAELTESEEKYRSLVEKTRDITCRIDAGGVLRYVAPQAAHYGFDPAELEGRFFLDLVHPEDRERMASDFQTPTTAGKTVPSEFRLCAPDGKTYWFEERSSRLYDASGKIRGITSVLREISARKQAEEAALRYRKHLRRLAARLVSAQDQEQRRIAEGLHDDVAQLLAACSIKLGEAEYADTLEAARPIHDQIDELLGEAVEKIRSLSFELFSSTLYRAGFRKALQELCEHMTNRYSIRFRLQWEEPVPELDDATATVLFRAVRELLFNVVKHARVKEALICVSMKEYLLEITVEDRGMGFKAPDKKEGRGLGLFGIEERLRDMGGRLEIDSRPGERTRVSLCVALREDEM